MLMRMRICVLNIYLAHAQSKRSNARSQWRMEDKRRNSPKSMEKKSRKTMEDQKTMEDKRRKSPKTVESKRNPKIMENKEGQKAMEDKKRKSMKTTENKKIVSMEDKKSPKIVSIEDKKRPKPVSMTMADKRRPKTVSVEDKKSPKTVSMEDKKRSRPKIVSMEDKRRPKTVSMEDKKSPKTVSMEDKKSPKTVSMEDKKSPKTVSMEDKKIPKTMSMEDKKGPKVMFMEDKKTPKTMFMEDKKSLKVAVDKKKQKIINKSPKNPNACTIKEILKSTFTVSKKLEALHEEHQAMVTDIEKSVNCLESTNIEEPEREFEIMLQKEKRKMMDQELNKLKRGMEETQLMEKMGKYITSLEAEKHTLIAQVKQLSSENDWLRKSLTESQHLLYESELALAELREDKKHNDFLNRLERNEREYANSLVNSGSSRSILSRSMQSSSCIRMVEEESPGSETENERECISRNVSKGSIQHDTRSVSSFEDSVNIGYEIPDNIKQLNQIFLQYIHQGKPDVALLLCQKAVEDLKIRTYWNNPDVASLLDILVDIYRELGEYGKAVDVLLRALEIREDVFGPCHPIVGTTLNNVAVLYGKCGDYKIAEPFCLRALEIRKKTFGTNHPDVAKQYKNLAILYSHLKKYDKTEYCHRRALEIFSKVFGPNDPHVIKTIDYLASCYVKQGKYEAAEALSKKVFKGSKKQKSPYIKHPKDMRLVPRHHPEQRRRSSRAKGPIQTRRRAESDVDSRKRVTESEGDSRRREAESEGDSTSYSGVTKAHTDGLRKLDSNSACIRGRQRLQDSKTALSWGWVFGQRTRRQTDQN